MAGSLRARLRSLGKSLVPEATWRRLQEVRQLRMVPGPFSYNQDGLTTVHNADFVDEPDFARAYALGKATGSWGESDVQWRAHVACWAAQRGLGLEGDFVECGVNRGGLARTILSYCGLENAQRRFFLLDTFSGLVDRYISDDERRAGLRAGGYQECFEAVQETFAPFRNVVLVRGAVPETLTQVDATKVAFLSVDMNCVAPEIAAAEFFWPKLSAGAAMVLDDYGWPGHIEQKRAFDAFARAHRVPILAMPTGQGLIVKP